LDGRQRRGTRYSQGIPVESVCKWRDRNLPASPGLTISKGGVGPHHIDSARSLRAGLGVDDRHSLRKLGGRGVGPVLRPRSSGHSVSPQVDTQPRTGLPVSVIGPVKPTPPGAVSPTLTGLHLRHDAPWSGESGARCAITTGHRASSMCDNKLWGQPSPARSSVASRCQPR